VPPYTIMRNLFCPLTWSWTRWSDPDHAETAFLISPGSGVGCGGLHLEHEPRGAQHARRNDHVARLLTPAPGAETATPEAPGQGPLAGSQTVIYLVAPEGGSGPVGPIGCGDYLVPVERGPYLPTTTDRQIAYALMDLFSIKEPFYGQSGLYDPLYQSSLSVQSVTVDANGHATVNLSGNLVLGGECDSPRVQAQIEDTVLQFSVTDVTVLLNGTPLADVLSGRGN
jgi:hypothetical protein